MKREKVNFNLKIFELLLLYIKKLFNWRNVLLFVISFICFFLIYKSIAKLITTVQYDLLFYDLDRLSIMIASVWLASMTQYAYIYLKKNNLSDNQNKNFLLNSIILISFYLICYSFFYFIIINKNDYVDYEERYIQINCLFWIFFFINFAELFFLGFFKANKRNDKFFYSLILAFVVMNFYVVFSLFQGTEVGGQLFELYYKKILLWSFVIFLSSAVSSILLRIIMHKKEEHEKVNF